MKKAIVLMLIMLVVAAVTARAEMYAFPPDSDVLMVIYPDTELTELTQGNHLVGFFFNDFNAAIGAVLDSNGMPVVWDGYIYYYFNNLRGSGIKIYGSNDGMNWTVLN